jgi:hypothetical protein
MGFSLYDKMLSQSFSFLVYSSTNNRRSILQYGNNSHGQGRHARHDRGGYRHSVRDTGTQSSTRHSLVDIKIQFKCGGGASC